MKKRLKFLTVLFTFIMVLTLVFAMTACKDPNPNEGEGEDEEEIVIDMLVNNGTFYSSKNSSNSQKYVKEVITGWSKNSGAISYSDAIMGGIDLSADKFDANKNTIKEGLKYPGMAPNTPKDKLDNTKLQDTNALVVASVEKAASVYYRTSSSINIEKNTYYKLAIDVWTAIEDATDMTGAWIYITDGVYAEYQFIDTKEVWETYELYIEGNNFENRTINIELWLGHGPNYIGTQSKENANPRLTKGVAVFDNVIMSEIGKDNYDAVKGNTDIGDVIKVASAIYPDENFTYESKISSTTTTSSTTKPYYGTKSGTPYNYELIVGKDGIDYSDDRPTVITGSTGTQGIFDMSKLYEYQEKTEEKEAEWVDRFQQLNSQFIAPNWQDFYKLDTKDDKNVVTPFLKDRGAQAEFEALMIYHSSPSAAGYKSKKKFMIEKNKYYQISVWTYVWAITEEDAYKEAFEYKDTYSEDTLKSLLTELNNYRKDIYKDNYFMEVDSKKVLNEDGEALEKEIYELIASIDTLTKDINRLENKTDKTEEEIAKLESLKTEKAAKDAALLSAKKTLYKAEAFVLDNEASTEGNPVYTNNLTTNSESLEKSIKEKNTKYKEYTDKNAEKLSQYNDTMNKYLETARKAKSHFKVTGASINEDSLDTQYSSTQKIGEWQQLTYFIRGNELSDRYVNFEFWYGEGLVGSDTLMVGGAFFDNVEITVASAEDFNKVFPSGDIRDFKELSPLGDDDKNIAGLLDEQTDNFVSIKGTNDLWNFSYEDKETSDDISKVGIVNGKVAANDDLWNAVEDFKGITRPGSTEVNYKGQKSIYNILMLRHLEYTSSKLEFSNVETSRELKSGLGDIIPNKFYRLSLMVMTQGLDKGKGATVNILKLDRDIDAIYERSVLTSITNINTKGEWQELVFYFKGDALDTNRITFEIQLGSGDALTPDNLLKGTVFATAITMQDNISYTEYKNVSSSTYTKTYAFTSSESTSDTVSNGNFINTDYSETFKNDPNAYNDKGDLVGVATPSNFSINNPINTLTEPKNLKYEGDGPYTLVWDKVDNATAYEIYLDNFKHTEDGKEVIKRNYMIASVSENKYQLGYESHLFMGGNIKVRAICDDNEDYGVSPMSSAIENKTKPVNGTHNYKVYDDFLNIDKNKLEYKFGVVNHKTFEDKNKDKPLKDIYPEGGYLSGKSDNLLMVSSDYYTRGGYTMTSSQSLDSNSYYEISVWVKTLNGAKASITVSNSSNIFYNTIYEDQKKEDGNYIGFVNQDTKGEWRQYRFYAETSVVSSSFKLEMFLGNKYAEDKKKDEDDSTSTAMIKQGLSKGTVFFDDIAFKKLTDEDAYKLKTEGTDEKPLKENQTEPYYKVDYFNNEYIYKKLIYTTDSFDASTKVDDESLLGDTPKEYSHSRATDGEDSDEARIYGVFDASNVKSEKLEHIYTSTNLTAEAPWLPTNFATDENVLKDFLTGYGRNVLFMANLKDNGQYYRSNSYSLSSESYYEISFYAKAILPEGKTAQFRFEYGDDTSKYSTIKIKGVEPENEYGFVKYTMYIYNERTSSVSGNKISFHLGTNIDGTKDFFKGLVAIDNVAITKIDKEVFEEVKTSFDGLSDEDKANAIYSVYTFEKKPETPPEDGGDDGDKNWFDQNIWLVLSTVIIGLIILIVVVKLSYDKIKKKVVRTKVRPENIIDKVKIEKETIKSKKDENDYEDYTD